MYLVRKSGTVMGARDDVQLAAFLNAEWEKFENADSVKKAAEIKKPEPETVAEPVIESGNAEDAGVDSVAPTKTDINRMTTANLREYGSEIGIEDAFDKNGATLKAEIIEKLGL